MKNNQTLRRIALAVSLMLLFQTCSSKTSFLNSSVVPAAEGSVKIKKDKNNNYVVDLDIIRLAEPERLSPPKNVYVVWMETKQNGVKNIGRLKTSSGLFSRTLKSSLQTVSPFEPTEIVITAEESASLQYPGSMVVLRTGEL